MRPQRITEYQLNRFNEKRVLDFIRDSQLEDPFLSISDLIMNNKGNEKNLISLFNRIEITAMNLLDSKEIKDLTLEKIEEVEKVSIILNYFSSRIYILGKRTAEKKDEYSTLRSITILRGISITAIKLKVKNETNLIKIEIYQIIEWIKLIERIAFENKMENIVSEIISTYTIIEKAAIDENVDDILHTHILLSINVIAKKLNDQKMESALLQLEIFFNEIIDMATRKKMDKFMIKLQESFELIKPKNK
jgi:hypothetical protein